MEFKQLEFFLMCVECGSFGKAAERLYTTQPNVSRVIYALESELGSKIFERTSRGLRLTDYGKSIYNYALNAVKNTNLILETNRSNTKKALYVSTYQSHSLAMLITDIYKANNISIEHRLGNVEEIISHVEQGISEIGIICISNRISNAFFNKINKKNIVFVPIAKLNACIYMGKENLYFNREYVELNEISNFKYVKRINDFFSIEDEFRHLSLGILEPENIKFDVTTNSEHLAMSLLMNTDIVDIGIDFDYPKHDERKIKKLPIKGGDTLLTIGYIIENGRALSEYADILVKCIKQCVQS